MINAAYKLTQTWAWALVEAVYEHFYTLRTMALYCLRTNRYQAFASQSLYEGDFFMMGAAEILCQTIGEFCIPYTSIEVESKEKARPGR